MSIRGFLILLLLSASISGCTVATAVSSGNNTALTGFDLIEMTDRMATSLAGSHQVNDAVSAKGRLTIVVQPVDNQLTGEILPAGQAEAFTARVRALLSQHAADRFTWVMNRDAFYRLRQKELDVDLGPSPDKIQPEYALVAKFQSLTDESSKRRTAAYLCVYQLSSIKDGSVLWADRYEVKKTAVKGFLD